MPPARTLWDTKLSTRIVINVSEVRNLQIEKKQQMVEPKSVNVHLVYGKTKYRTGKAENGKINEIFSFDFASEDSITFKACEGSDTIGAATLSDIISIPFDIAFTKWFDLTTLTKKKKGEPQEAIKVGEIKVIYLVTQKTEALPYEPNGYLPQVIPCEYYYRTKFPKTGLKTGDLLLFGGTGAVSSYVRARYGIQYSGVGLVVSLPNKYTHVSSLYVFEFGSNFSKLPDDFYGSPLYGLPTLVELTDRIHGHYGGAVWMMQLKERLQKVEEQQLCDAVFAMWEDYLSSSLKESDEEKVGKNSTYQLVTPTPDPWLDGWGCRGRLRLAELIGPAAVALALAAAGRKITASGQMMELSDIVMSGYYLPARLLRVPEPLLKHKEVMNVVIGATEESLSPRPLIAGMPTEPPELPPEKELPQGWEMRMAEDGAAYYINKKLHKSQWTVPADAQS